jgi:ABC-type glutathione transport system ATPase component
VPGKQRKRSFRSAEGARAAQRSADKIIVMHKGNVREIGSHQELLAQRGIYLEALPVTVQRPGTRRAAAPSGRGRLIALSRAQ